MQHREQAISTLGMEIEWLYESLESDPNDPCQVLEAAQEAAWLDDPTGKHVKRLTEHYLSLMTV